MENKGKNMINNMILILCFVFLVLNRAYADQTLVAQKLDTVPIIDGLASDEVWNKATEITTHDKIADIDITIKAVYTEKKIYFLVTFPDADESKTHRSWIWNKGKKDYVQGKDREDVFVFKWNMQETLVDLSIYADNEYMADIWFWKACRTNPLGFSDDKLHYLSLYPLKQAKELKSKSGKKTYLKRPGDLGSAAYATDVVVDYKGNIIPRFKNRHPSKSRADIKAKGVWNKGKWTIEFSRALVTLNKDDIAFDVKKTYQFGVSRYEIAGRDKENEATQPLYGCGDISENLTLKFAQ